MLEIVLKGILIGLFLSVPTGPIGMLCIQRTFNRGRWHGIATGLGATFSDLVYTIITLFFLSFVMDFIEHNRLVIQLIVSAVLVAFGIYIYRSHPSTQPKPNDTKKHTLIGDFFTAFWLTLSNPLILFALIILFARFEFINSKTTIILLVSGLGSILLGATLWWFTLTFLVSRFKNKVNARRLIIVNRVTGIIIVLLGCVGIIKAF
jgi:threonine/homoserine/homoserine lactone efflux protein